MKNNFEYPECMDVDLESHIAGARGIRPIYRPMATKQNRAIVWIRSKWNRLAFWCDVNYFLVLVVVMSSLIGTMLLLWHRVYN